MDAVLLITVLVLLALGATGTVRSIATDGYAPVRTREDFDSRRPGLSR